MSEELTDLVIQISTSLKSKMNAQERDRYYRETDLLELKVFMGFLYIPDLKKTNHLDVKIYKVEQNGTATGILRVTMIRNRFFFF